MAGSETFSELTGLIYEAAMDPRAWPAALTRLADVVGATQVTLSTYDHSAGIFSGIAPRTDPTYMSAFLARWVSHEPNPSLFRAPVGTWHCGYEFITRRDLVRTELCNEWCRPQGIDRIRFNQLIRDGSLGAGVNFTRSWADGEFASDKVSLLNALTPHLQRAVQLNLRLAQLEAGNRISAAALDRLRQGILVVSQGAKVLFANSAAEAILAEGDGLSSDDEGLRAATAAVTARLRRLIAGIANGPGSSDRPATPLVLPLPMPTTLFSHIGGTAIVFLTDPDQQQQIRKAGLQRHFGFTRAEAAVALEIVSGQGLKWAADRLGISITTARTHLAHCFEKTHTRRQADLVRLILESHAGLLDA